MSRRMTLGALVVFCAMALTAVAASGAQAAGWRMFTCKQIVNGNTDNHCTPGSAGTGNHGHVAIPLNESTQLTLTALNTQVLKTEIASTSVELRGTSMECVGCMVENHEEGGVSDVTGSGGKIKYSSVTVSAPHCAVEDPTTHETGVVTTEPLKVTTTSTGGVKISPASGTIITTLHFINSGGACFLGGEEIPIEGFVEALASGATWTVTAATSHLTIFEEPASLEGQATASGGLTGGEHNALSLTQV